ncbi:beta-xylosidase [Burkholderia sp. Leaf177]|uniref:beta-xylosidase n=1 Tax=Burkholderia sp. Leaf177 TaxID=1736287 RepID=UPI000AE8AD0E|nr:beta-xylosidase [Burkholderia sp. Leaf177]
MAQQINKAVATSAFNASFRKRLLPHATAVLLGSILLGLSTYSLAQISQGNGSSSQENRTSAAGTTPDASASTVHESLKPQSKEAKGNARGMTAGKQNKTEGAGGFNNGLYGTGAGSNK